MSWEKTGQFGNFYLLKLFDFLLLKLDVDFVAANEVFFRYNFDHYCIGYVCTTTLKRCVTVHFLP